MLDNIASLFLRFSHDIIVVPIIILGFIWLKRETFYHAICLLLFSILYSHALKVYFQIYSPIYGLIFPSGHMLAPTVLYGWLAYKYKNITFKIMVLILLCGIGASLIHFNYHDYNDVIGGAFFAIILLLTYNFILQKRPEFLLYFNLILANVFMLYLSIRLDNILPHLWLSYYALMGFTISSKIFYNQKIIDTTKSKILSSILYFISFAIIYSIFNTTMSNLPIYIFQLQWLFFAIFIPSSCFVSQKILKLQSHSL
jgi:hypothetical protein